MNERFPTFPKAEKKKNTKTWHALKYSRPVSPGGCQAAQERKGEYGPEPVANAIPETELLHMPQCD